ncbi:MAG: phage shock protein A [Deltaproteobacteria bacterium RIFOXYB12_FULL_58_9]|nr:MAG: phage shock protein A [Deltaproteobacteria bacterium RIFOXYB12_FULL_58_9]
MSWVERFSLVMRSSITTLREKVEDPERLLHQLIVDMEEEQERVRQSVAAAIADEILLKKKLAQSRAEAEEWMQRAAQALRKSDEASSRMALEQKALATERADSLDVEYAKHRKQTAELQSSVGDLDDKIRQAKQKQTVLLARFTRAQSKQRVDSALRHADGKSAFAEFSRLENRVERAEAMSEAYERLDGKNPDTEELKRRLDDQERRDKIEKELEELKRRVGNEDQAQS